MSCSVLLFLAVKTVSLVLFYYFFSISLTFYNKWILMGYPFPVTITMVHLVVKFLIASFIRKVWSCATGRAPVVLGWKDFLRNITPIAVFSALDIGLSNWSLLFITVSLYTMSKSTALIFILFFSILFRLEQPRVLQIGVVGMIVLGLFLFTYERTTFSVEGFILVISASVISGMRWATAQFTLQKEDLGLSNPVDVVYHLQPVMIITLLPLAIPVDGTAVSTSVLVFRADSFESFSWTLLFILPATFLAFMLGVSEYLLVYHTSGLTLSVAGVFKEILTLGISTLYWEEESLTALHAIGMVICVSGISLHVLLKSMDTRRAEKEQTLKLQQEDAMELIPKLRKGQRRKKVGSASGSSTDSEDSEVVYETSRM